MSRTTKQGKEVAKEQRPGGRESREEYGGKQMEVGVPETDHSIGFMGKFRSSETARASLEQSSFCGVSAGTSWFSARMDAQRNRTRDGAANCLEMSLGADMNETLIPKEFGVEEWETNATNGVVVPAIRLVDRHPHQVATDGANRAEAPSSSRAWFPKRGCSFGHWEERVSLVGRSG